MQSVHHQLSQCLAWRWMNSVCFSFLGFLLWILAVPSYSFNEQAMVSGAIGGYLDVAFNFNTQALLDDNLIGKSVNHFNGLLLIIFVCLFSLSCLSVLYSSSLFQGNFFELVGSCWCLVIIHGSSCFLGCLHGMMELAVSL